SFPLPYGATDTAFRPSESGLTARANTLSAWTMFSMAAAPLGADQPLSWRSSTIFRPQMPPWLLAWAATAFMATSSGCRNVAPGPESTVTAPILTVVAVTPVSVVPPLWAASQPAAPEPLEPLELVPPELVPPDRVPPDDEPEPPE